jgi:acid phosphatase
MTTHIPRPFYSQEELDRLYPKELELQLVQIV